MPADAAPAHVWVSELGAAGERVVLGDQESRYVARVCRARIGETLTLTDGRGGLARARVESLGRPVTVVLESAHRESARYRAEVLCGPLAGERGDWLVEKLAELGVASFRPVHCERARWPTSTDRRARWARLARAALQQSLGRFEMEVRSPVALADAVRELEPGVARFVADPRGTPASALGRERGRHCAVLVGPAEGLSSTELESVVSSSFAPMSLSGMRLRTETAALAWAAWWAGSAAGEGLEAMKRES